MLPASLGWTRSGSLVIQTISLLGEPASGPELSLWRLLTCRSIAPFIRMATKRNAGTDCLPVISPRKSPYRQQSSTDEKRVYRDSPFLRLPKSRSLRSLSVSHQVLCRDFGPRFAERFYRNALVPHFQHGQGFSAARRMKNNFVTLCSSDECARQG